MKKTIPDMLYIESTNICNANCIFCAYQYDKQPKGTIDFELLKKVVIDYKKAGGTKISLSPLTGEIFVDKDILRKINFIRDIGFDLIYTYTNALLFHKFDIKDILTSGLTRLNISTAPLDEETYIKIYRNRNYKQLLKNLANLLKHFDIIQEKTIQHISIEFRSNVPLKEIKKLPDYQKYIEPYINKNISVSAMQTFDSWMGAISQDQLLDGMYIKDPNFKKDKPCIRLNMLQILPNGDTRVCGCRFDSNADKDIFTIGNVYQKDIVELYNDKKVKDLKNSFYAGNIPKECQLCSWYEEG